MFFIIIFFIGSAICPGVGTIIGAIIGCLVGVFCSSKVDKWLD